MSIVFDENACDIYIVACIYLYIYLLFISYFIYSATTAAATTTCTTPITDVYLSLYMVIIVNILYYYYHFYYHCYCNQIPHSASPHRPPPQQAAHPRAPGAGTAVRTHPHRPDHPPDQDQCGQCAGPECVDLIRV